jgi:hypothetical protein
MVRLTRTFSVLALAAIALVPNPALAMTKNVFYGIVSHVSVNNIKVTDPHSHQSLSFEIVPHFDQVLNDNGKATYQMKDVKPGRFVAVVYDQKALGIRHADRIYIMNNAHERLKKVGG